MRVFLDANILFSAAQPKSRLRALLDLVARHGECITNAYAVEEARRNLALKQPTLVPHLETLVRKMEQVPGLIAELPVKLPTKDIPILGGAIAGAATHLLTGDEQDFGDYFGRTIRGVKVLTPRMLADELERQGWQGPRRQTERRQRGLIRLKIGRRTAGTQGYGKLPAASARMSPTQSTPPVDHATRGRPRTNSRDRWLDDGRLFDILRLVERTPRRLSLLLASPKH